MEQYLRDLSEQILNARAVADQTVLPSSYAKPEKVLFCGMGGSAISGDILSAFAQDVSGMLWVVNRTPKLPKWVDEKTLVILSSYSGNTHEIQQIFRQAVAQDASILVMASGGWLAEEAGKKRLPCLRLPKGYPPRCAIGYLTFSVLFFFVRQGWVLLSDEELEEVLRTAKKFPQKKAKTIAKKIFQKSIRLYGGGFMQPVALRWRTQLAENAKTLASCESLPEMFHHEIEGWKFPAFKIKRSVAIFFSDRGEPEWLRIKKRVAMQTVKKQGAAILELRAEGKSPLARIFSAVMLGDWTSYELAKLYRVDPLSISAIDKIKKAVRSPSR